MQQANSELEQKLMQLMLAYDRAQEWFQFRFMLYNFVDNAAAYEKPANVHPVLWQQVACLAAAAGVFLLPAPVY